MPDRIIPKRQQPEDDKGYFEILTKSVFQAGFSHQIIERKWSGFREIFENFDPKKIANWNEEDIIFALESPKIVRNERKIKATVDNAKQFLDYAEKYGSFGHYISSIREGGYENMKKELVDNFKWLGKTGAFVFLYTVAEDVPKWENR